MNELEDVLRATTLEATATAAVTGFTARALADDLVDVAYAVEPSPIGTLTIAATPLGIARIGFAEEEILTELAAKISPRILYAPARLDDARRELDEYFAGARTTFGVPIDRCLSSGFRRTAQEAISAIPYGAVVTYRDIATAAGSPGATRAAGTACATNPIPVIVPCHRVLSTGGGLGGYSGGIDIKQFLLRLEGVIVA